MPIGIQRRAKGQWRYLQRIVVGSFEDINRGGVMTAAYIIPHKIQQVHPQKFAVLAILRPDG